MAYPFRLVENGHIQEILDPATDAAGRTGLWVNCKYSHKVHIVFHVQQGNAATILISLLQATSNGGGNSKAGPNVNIWVNQDTSLATGNDTLTIQAAANTFTTSAATKNKLVVFEVDPVSLDFANSFQWITISTGASNAGNLTQAVAYHFPIRYEQATPPQTVS